MNQIEQTEGIVKSGWLLTWKYRMMVHTSPSTIAGLPSTTSIALIFTNLIWREKKIKIMMQFRDLHGSNTQCSNKQPTFLFSRNCSAVVTLLTKWSLFNRGPFSMAWKTKDVSQRLWDEYQMTLALKRRNFWKFQYNSTRNENKNKWTFFDLKAQATSTDSHTLHYI